MIEIYIKLEDFGENWEKDSHTKFVNPLNCPLANAIKRSKGLKLHYVQMDYLVLSENLSFTKKEDWHISEYKFSLSKWNEEIAKDVYTKLLNKEITEFIIELKH